MAQRDNDVILGQRAEGWQSGPTVLVVEDDPLIIDLLREIVSSCGLSVSVASSASEALYQLEAPDTLVACVILDYGIPGMDPTRLLSRMREIQSGIKVLLSSGYSKSFIDREFSLDLVEAFVPKPYEPHTLVQALEGVLGRPDEDSELFPRIP